uniref:DNA cytosine methyltransferase n=1 Tax=Siphoviridae sp. ctgaU3 TaxID=2825609 RepID=A0A8S5UW13_9CAUD|nr:MAG TPA: DNA cytosine methyltransferase [Siphoviridae sp. ctgaU3]
MCSGTGELSAALQSTLRTPTALTSLSDADPSSRAYLRERFPTTTIYADCRDQNIPGAAATIIGAPCQDLSCAGRHAGAAPGTGTRSALIHDCIAAATSAPRRPRATPRRLRRMDDGPPPGGNSLTDRADPASRQRGRSPPGGPHAHPRTRTARRHRPKGALLMRHAAPHSNTLDRRLNRAGQLVFGAVAYTIVGLAACFIALGSALAVWAFWQWMGVN